MFGKKANEQTPDLSYFQIYDTKSQVFVRDPMGAQNTFAMIRDLENMHKDPNAAGSPFVTHSEDFQLFKIGDFYRSEGKMVGHEPEHVINLWELKPRVTPGAGPQGIVAT